MHHPDVGAQKDQQLLKLFVAHVIAPAAPEVHQIGAPLYVFHISTVLKAAHEA